ncbi:hypothetical protein BG003_010736 [Podila horticola]|nr:hypothetical protein BG003_010736 [Podila horticola]
MNSAVNGGNTLGGIEIPRDQVAALSPSCINYDLPSPTYTGLRPSNGSSADRKEGNIDESFTASHAGSHDLAHGFDQCLPKDEESVAGVQVSVSQPLLETPQPDEHDCKIATPLLDLQEQGYAMVSPGKTIVPREFEERLAVITENLMLISLKGVAPVVDECSSSPLDARYLERSSSDQDMPVEGLADQGSLESDGQDEIYLTWLLQRGAVEMEDMALTKAEEVVPASYVISTYELLGQCPFIAKDVPLVPEIRPLGHVQVSKQVRFDPYIHFIMSSLVREDEDLASASSEGPCNSLITDFGQDIASPPSLPDSPVQKSSPFFVDAEFHHLLPALPLTPTLESVLSAFATVEFFSPSHFDEVDLSTLPPLPSSPEVDFINTFTSQVPSEPPTTQDSNTDTDCQPQPSSSNHHNPRVMPLQLNTTLRQHLSDKSANSRSWTMLKSPVSTIRHASSSPLTPASPRTIELAATRQQLQYWTQTATKLRDQERMLTTRIDTLITEMAELIDRCETSEMGLQATEDELQELQRKLVEEQEIGFASIQEAALSIQENHLLGIALEETWKELDLMRGAWVDLHRQQRIEQEVKFQAYREQQSLSSVASLLAVPCSHTESTSVVGTNALEVTLSCQSADDTHKPKDALSMLKFVAVSSVLTMTMTACLLILLGDQSTLHRAGGAVILARRNFEPVVCRYSLLAKDEILEHWVEMSQAVGEYAKTAVVVPVQHVIAAWSGIMEYQSEMWSLLTASSSRYSLLS